MSTDYTRRNARQGKGLRCKDHKRREAVTNVTSNQSPRPYRAWTTRSSSKPRRMTLLYRRWHDLSQRVKGRATRSVHLYEGLELGWSSFAEFRAWALANGFSKENSSPDRIDAGKGYVPGNVRFIPPYENTFTALDDYNHWRARERCAAADDSDVPF